MALQQTVCTVADIKCIYWTSRPKVSQKGEITGTEFLFQSDQYIPQMGITLSCVDIVNQMDSEKKASYLPNIKFTISAANLEEPTRDLQNLLDLREGVPCTLTLAMQTDMIPQSENSRGVAYVRMTYMSVKRLSSVNGKATGINTATKVPKSSTVTTAYGSQANSSTPKAPTGTTVYGSQANSSTPKAPTGTTAYGSQANSSTSKASTGTTGSVSTSTS